MVVDLTFDQIPDDILQNAPMVEIGQLDLHERRNKGTMKQHELDRQ